MMISLATLHTQVLWAGFALSFVLGLIAQRSHFCTMGAVADIVTMGDWRRMRTWVLAMATALFGFGCMAYFGWVDASKSLYGGVRWLWLSTLIGGLMFGFGMVLASGCGLKTLVRLGSGNLKSLVVFLVMGLAALATLRGITGVLRVQTVDQVALLLPTGQDLPSLLVAVQGALPGLKLTKPQWAGLLGSALAALLALWVLRSPQGRERHVWLTGVGIGALVVGMWWVSGQWGRVAEHPSTLEEAFLATHSKRMESLSFVAPLAYALDWLLFFSDSARVLTLGVVSAAGVVLGSTTQSLAGRSFLWEAFRDLPDLVHHLLGAVLMGVGGITAMGCTIGQGLSGLSTLSLGSFTALMGILTGAYLALHWQQWQVRCKS
jgi:uncharacterized protein